MKSKHLAWLQEEIAKIFTADTITTERYGLQAVYRKADRLLRIHTVVPWSDTLIVHFPRIGERLALFAPQQVVQWPHFEFETPYLTSAHLDKVHCSQLSGLRHRLSRWFGPMWVLPTSEEKNGEVRIGYARQTEQVAIYDALEAGFCIDGIQKFLAERGCEGRWKVPMAVVEEWAARDGRANEVLNMYHWRRRTGE